MQTFITRTTTEQGAIRACYGTAQDLDPKRLGKQRVETKQIYEALTTGRGWIHHPATKMWNGFVPALATYGFVMCQVWRERGFEDSLLDYFEERATLSTQEGFDPKSWPWWFGDPNMVATHRSKLHLKLPQYYGPDWGRTWEQDGMWETLALPYIWPGMDPFEPYKKFYISKAEYKRIGTGEWELPPNWKIRPETREVIIT